MNQLVTQPQGGFIAVNHTPEEMFKMAKAIADGRMFGISDPNAVFTLLLIAQAEGKHPAIALRDYHIIEGRPSKRADAMLMDFQAAGGKVEWTEMTDHRVSGIFSHPQGGRVEIDWDNERVKNAGLDAPTRNGKPSNHAKFPRAMKRARVISEGVRAVFPGATGSFYVPEEVADFEEVAPARNAPPRPESRKASPFQKPADMVEVEVEPAPAQPHQPPADLDTDALEADITDKLNAAQTVEALTEGWKHMAEDINQLKQFSPAGYERVAAVGAKRKAEIGGEVGQ